MNHMQKAHKVSIAVRDAEMDLNAQGVDVIQPLKTENGTWSWEGNPHEMRIMFRVGHKKAPYASYDLFARSVLWNECREFLNGVYEFELVDRELIG